MAPILSKNLLVDSKSPKRRPLARLRGYFLAGVLVTAPVAITLASAWWFVGFVDSKVVPLIPGRYNPDVYLKDIVGFEIGLPGLGVVVLLVLITLIGALTAGFVGRYVVHLGERVLARMPVIRSVYAAIKQIFETVLKQQSTAFRQAVLIEYPRRGIWAVGFITGNTEGEVQKLTKDKMVNVFLPTTPNPTSGFLLFVPQKELINLSMSVEEAIKMVISAGIVTPPYRQLEEKHHVPIAPVSDNDLTAADDNVKVTPKKAKRKKVPSPSAD
jgi:uncharacterized membrane protein